MVQEISSDVAQGGCYCGLVKFRFAEPAVAFVNCHCSQCRRASGAAVTTWLCADRSGFQVDQADGALSSFVMTENVARYFCRMCGTHVYSMDARRPDIVGVPAGVLTSHISGAPTRDYFLADQAAWSCRDGDAASQP